MKQNALIAKREGLRGAFSTGLKDLIAKFKRSSLWTGYRKTTEVINEEKFESNFNGADDQFTRVSWTVPYAYRYFINNYTELISVELDVEKTNCSGATIDLVIDGQSFGKATAPELMKLKSFIGSNDFLAWIKNTPTRDTGKNWEVSDDAEMPVDSWTSGKVTRKKTISEKRKFIVPNPDASHHKTPAPPVTDEQKITYHVANTTEEIFSGGISETQVALILGKRKDILTQLDVLLKQLNDIEVVNTEIEVRSLYEYLLKI